MKKISFQMIGSSSFGNCAVLRTPQSTVLIDAGFSGKKIKENLATLGLSLSDIDAVFFTHEHTDHSKGVCGLSQAENLAFFANRATASEIERKQKKKLDWLFFDTGTSFEFRDLRITPFEIQHDSADPVGFVFSCGESAGTQEKLAWLTDCGKITNIVRRAVANVDALVLEANYDEKMLSESERPLELKVRIRGAFGHLSNDAAADFLKNYDNDRLERLIFAHVSRECNACKIVAETCANAFRGARGTRSDVVDPCAMLPPNAGWGF